MAHLCSVWLIVCFPLFASQVTCTLDEASMKTQLEQCIPSLTDQLKSATQKIQNCNAIQTSCKSASYSASPILELHCARRADCETDGCKVASLEMSKLSCGGKNPKEILNEFIDRWCFSKPALEVWTDINLSDPRLAFSLTLNDFWIALDSLKPTNHPLPDKDTLVAFLLDPIAKRLRDQCGSSLSVECGKYLDLEPRTEIQGHGCPLTKNEREAIRRQRVIAPEDIPKTVIKTSNPSAVAFMLKMSHPNIRMEKATKAIYDILCSTDEVTKDQPYKTMMYFKNAVKKAAAKYTIA